MDKFFLKSFKIGKIFSAIAILLTVITIAVSAILMCCSIKQYKINYYTPKELQEFEKSRVEINKITDIQEVKDKYGNRIEAILKSNYYDAIHYQDIVDILASIKPKYRYDYVENLGSFLDKGKAYAEDNLRKEAGNANKNIVEKVLKQYKKAIETTTIISYSKMYVAQVENIEAQKAADNMYRLWLTGIILCSVLIFISFLIVPLLIKIEENTRK